MKNKKLAMVVLIVGLIFIIMGITIGTYLYIDNQNKEDQKTEDNILNSYDVFKNNIDIFNNERATYYDSVDKNLFPESVEEEYENWIAVLNTYTNAIDVVEESSKELKEQCVNKYHSNEDVKNKCESFVIAYETVVNYYTKDINTFNQTIENYLNSKSEVKEGISLYQLKYDYTDINLDGKFIGKD